MRTEPSNFEKNRSKTAFQASRNPFTLVVIETCAPAPSDGSKSTSMSPEPTTPTCALLVMRRCAFGYSKSMCSICSPVQAVVFQHCSFTAVEGIQKERGGEKIRAPSRREPLFEQCAIELIQCRIPRRGSRSSRFEYGASPALHQLQPFRTPAVKNAGGLQGSHDVQQSRQPARFFAQTSVSGRSQTGQSNIDHVRKTRAGLAASASCSVTNSHQVSMRDKLQTRPVWNPGNAARALRHTRGRRVLITARTRHHQP